MASTEQLQRFKDARERLKIMKFDGPKAADLIDAFEPWLSEHEQDLAARLRLAQVMLADPERPGVWSRACVKLIMKPLLHLWDDASDSRDLLLLKALSTSLLGELLISDLLQTHSSPVNRENLEPTWSPSKIMLNLEQFNENIQNLKNTNSPIYTQNLVTILVNNISKIAQESHENNTKIKEDLEKINLQMISSADQPERQLLWWGQARYSHIVKKPYRKLFDKPHHATWWACVEAAELSRSLEFAPSAAYLVNTLEDMGLNVNARRPLRAWLTELVALLKEVEPQHPKHVRPSPALAELATEDALGLPVTWARLGGQGKPDEQLAIPLDFEIDHGDFATLIFTELRLDGMFAEANP